MSDVTTTVLQTILIEVVDTSWGLVCACAVVTLELSWCIAFISWKYKTALTSCEISNNGAFFICDSRWGNHIKTGMVLHHSFPLFRGKIVSHFMINCPITPIVINDQNIVTSKIHLRGLYISENTTTDVALFQQLSTLNPAALTFTSKYVIFSIVLSQHNTLTKTKYYLSL